MAGTFLTAEERPITIHDFSGFPRKLHEMEYPAPGDPALAARVVRLLGEMRASLRSDWGLDHGTWTVLHHFLPEADCPVVQLSIDRRMPPRGHFELGQALAPLRDEGVLVMGSGNITHNLGYAISSAGQGDLSTPGWASRFDEAVRLAASEYDRARLARIIESPDGRQSHPTIDHYLPLLYAAGAASEKDEVSFPLEGFDMGSLSMRAILFS